MAWHAVRSGSHENLKLALQAKADPNFRGPSYSRGTLLHAACESGSLSCARMLIEGTVSPTEGEPAGLDGRGLRRVALPQISVVGELAPLIVGPRARRAAVWYWALARRARQGA